MKTEHTGKYEGRRDNEQGHTQTLNTEEEQGKEQTPGKTRLTLITQTRRGRANRTSRTQTEDYQSKTVSTLNFTDSDPQVDTMTTRT